MQRKEEVMVGLFVLAALGILLATLVYVGQKNIFGRKLNHYTLRTKFAAGIESGAPIRYAGMKIGKVEKTSFDSKDPSRAVITLSVEPSLAIPADSKAKVSSLGLLGEYYIEITPGSSAEVLRADSEIPVEESIQWNELVNQFGGATEEAKGLISDARPRVRQALDNINDLTNEENRKRVRDSLQKIDQILTDARPRLKTILANFDSSSAKIDKFMDEIKGTRENLDRLLNNWSGLAGGKDRDVEQTLKSLRDTLVRAEQAMDEVRRLLVANREHFDVTMENIDVSSENIRELTDTLKQRPSSLIFSKNPPDRRPGQPAGRR